MQEPADGPQAGSTVGTTRGDPQLLRGEVTVRDFLLVTYLVPPARLADHLPERLRPQTFVDGQGRERAFVSATCFLNDGLGWAGGPSPRIDAHQATYRTYVRDGDEVGSYFLASYLATTPSTVLQRLGLADTRRAEFEVDVERDADGRYVRYRATMAADDGTGRVHVVDDGPAPTLPPFATADEHVRFLTHRLHGYAYSLAGVVVDAQVEHPELSAHGGRLLEARFPPLERLGLVSFEEQHRPYSVLLSPGARFELLAPVPLR